MEVRIQHHIVEKESTLRDYCLDKLQWQPDFFEKILDIGGIYIDRKRCEKNQKLRAGSYLRLHTQPKRFRIPQNIEQLLVEEEEDFWILHKSSGLPVHATLDNAKENLLYQWQSKTGKAAYITHRLDVETEGLILLAKNKDFQRQFNEALQTKQVVKIYQAHCEAELQQGEYIHYMQKSKTAPKKLFEDAAADRMLCRMEILAVIEKQHWLQLHTGRPHQIRAQMAFLGAPILGDTMYGAKAAHRFGLVASYLRFPYKNSSFEVSIADCFLGKSILS
tara:strand:+ start:8676 stop:9506 length:831 start_codon:yes stop_codon:yes gene_type:complete